MKVASYTEPQPCLLTLTVKSLLETCGQLKTYVTQGGSILNTHDTMTKYKDKGAVNLTNSLRSAFGMDRFHVQ